MEFFLCKDSLAKCQNGISTDQRGALDHEENLVVFNGRFIYVKYIKCEIGEGENRPAYAYLCLDCTMKREEEYKLSQKVVDTAMNRIENEFTLKGHLLITFIATVVMKMLSDKLKDTNLTAEMLFMALDQHHAKIYKDKIIVNEATKVMNYAYRKFKIKVPTEVEYIAQDGLWDIINNVGAEWILNDVDTKTSGN